MGAQKGGTTALHSYLMLHPQLNPPRKKELHIFDIDRNFNSWPNQLKVAFRVPKQPILKKQHESISFESTPSYIASTLACERMSTFLSPWTVYVLILRDPVKRLWSEYNMKARRIQNQDTTLQSLFDHADDLAVCWTPTENDDDAVDGAKSKDSSGDSVPPAEKMRREHCQEALDKHLDGSRVKASQVSRRMVNLKFAMDFKRKCVDTAKLGASIEESRECARKLGVLRETLPDIRQDIIQETKSLQPCVDMAAGKQFSEAKVPVSALPWTAREQECQGKLKTRICPQCVREADSEGCVAKCFSASNGTAQELAIQMGCTPPDVGPYPSHKLRSPSACSGDLCTCYPKAVNMADISKNFLWRGLYYPQVQQCLRYIPRSQLLIVDNDDLRRDPASVLGKITNELGLRDAPYGGPGFTYADASNEFSRKYPEFASTTGWSEDGSSSVPMPEDIELMLRSFYATPNKMLFDLIGKKFDHWL
ncbi:Heparan sulfate glucosamine 3-O-sulfotransferase 1 [Hondaea fermentalgiana]|uniref:Heparan sulfate glucosamine 3-O-sulfotransferase 1 n=1 Tax=Hondaea fermentalgiana TaxID=2315210 RepID=A0A2R5G9B3_9STRA|nr:Heparan sulfate glucosamine 3-O-sulfotransferase 1 [Hondaea fermentalgiana]|eukprot:GBG27610.1 Heparan sulfate glucosamine 3-O-sulfotransferase 1 [Hondaea fermentalgiana]